MQSLALEMALVVVLVLVNGFLAGSEVALVSMRVGQIERLRRQSGPRPLLARLAADPNRFLATIQIGITLAGFLASATAAVSLAEYLAPSLSVLGELAKPVAILLVTGVLTFVTLVFGELVPKRIALQRAEQWGVAAARPLALVGAVTAPVVWVLGKTTDLVVRVLGGDPAVQRVEMDEAELREMISSRTDFHRVRRRVLSGAFQIAERKLRQLVVPRAQVLFVSAEAEVHDGLAALLRSGHSRAPVHGGDPDDVVGVVHLRDLVGQRGRVSTFTRPALVLPETMPALQALQEMQRKRQHLAVIIDEHGGTEGIVTIEDLLEELVGEIYDEFDRDLRAVQQNRDGSIDLSGMFPLHDLPDLGLTLPTSRSTTVAGLVMETLGRIAKVGDAVDIDGWQAEVTETAGKRIKRVRVRKRPSSVGDAPAGT